MKRQILFFVMILLSMTASAQGTVKIDGICYKLNSGDKTAEVVYQRRHEYSGEVVIPSSVTYNDVDYSVTSIGNQAFSRSTDLTSVSIPATVTSIGSNIFYECTSLASIVIEEGNAVYDTRENCNAIIETASNKLLYGCMGSTIPDGVASIENSAFSGCTGLASAIIPNSVTSIGNAAFSGCTSLAFINIPNSVTSIGKYVFGDCSNLATIILPGTITTIDDYAFIRCGLTDMYCYAEQLPVIGSSIFMDTYYKATLHVPASSVDAYRNAEQWNEFPNIVALTDEEMGVEDVMMQKDGKESAIYDLNGRKVAQPTKGIYIQNGKKHVVR